MAIVSQITGVDQVLKALDAETKKHPRRASVIVGYRTEYALSVHERVEMKWKGLPRSGEVRFGGIDKAGNRWVKAGYDPGEGKGFYWDPVGKAQAKFLETPAREKRGRIGEIIVSAVEGGASIEQGLVLAGMFLQRESQMLVPVDTGKLKASAFTELEKVQR